MDSNAFLTLTPSNGTSSQLVDMTPYENGPLLSQETRKELRAGHIDFPAQVTETGRMA